MSKVLVQQPYIFSLDRITLRLGQLLTEQYK